MAETTRAERTTQDKQHLEWARDHGGLDEIAGFLRSLTESEWCHFGDD